MRHSVHENCYREICPESGWIETYDREDGSWMLVRTETAAPRAAAFSIAALARIVEEDRNSDGDMLPPDLLEEANRALRMALKHPQGPSRSAKDVGDKDERLEDER